MGEQQNFAWTERLVEGFTGNDKWFEPWKRNLLGEKGKERKMDTPSKRKTIKQRCGKVYTTRKEGFKVKEQPGWLKYYG